MLGRAAHCGIAAPVRGTATGKQPRQCHCHWQCCTHVALKFTQPVNLQFVTRCGLSCSLQRYRKCQWQLCTPKTASGDVCIVMGWAGPHKLGGQSSLAGHYHSPNNGCLCNSLYWSQAAKLTRPCMPCPRHACICMPSRLMTACHCCRDPQIASSQPSR